MRGDALASGAKSAIFIPGQGRVSDPITLRNLSTEPRTEFQPAEVVHEKTVEQVLPLYDHVLVKRDVTATESEGGIYIPTEAREQSTIGTVVAVGKGRLNGAECVPMQVQAGDAVLFGKYDGTDIRIDGEALTLMREDSIRAIVVRVKK